MSKVSLKTCTLPKHLGGLGLLDISKMATKMAAKWIVRAIDTRDYWAHLITRHSAKAQLKDLRAWTGFSTEEIFLSKIPFIHKGSPFVKSLWAAWEKYRGYLQIKNSNQALNKVLEKDSLWTGTFGPDLNREDLLRAHKLCELGLKH